MLIFAFIGFKLPEINIALKIGHPKRTCHLATVNFRGLLGGSSQLVSISNPPLISHLAHLEGE